MQSQTIPEANSPTQRPWIIAFLCAVILFVNVLIWAPLMVLNRILFSYFKFGRPFEDALVVSFNLLSVRLFGLKCRVIDREKYYSKEEPCLVIANHSSLVDIGLIYEATRKGGLRMLAKKELFRTPFFGWALWASHFVSIDRGHPESARIARETLSSRLKANYQMFLAPEGTRSKDGKLLPFKSGAFRIAVEQNVPIVIIALLKPWVFLPKSQIIPISKGLVEAHFVAKIVPSDPTAVGYDQEKEILRLKNLARELMLKAGLEDSLC